MCMGVLRIQIVEFNYVSRIGEYTYIRMSIKNLIKKLEGIWKKKIILSLLVLIENTTLRKSVYYWYGCFIYKEGVPRFDSKATRSC